MNVALWETQFGYVVIHSRLIGSLNNTKHTEYGVNSSVLAQSLKLSNAGPGP